MALKISKAHRTNIAQKSANIIRRKYRINAARNKKIKCKITDIKSLTHENFQPRIDLAGLLTYSCFATFPMKSVVIDVQNICGAHSYGIVWDSHPIPFSLTPYCY